MPFKSNKKLAHKSQVRSSQQIQQNNGIFAEITLYFQYLLSSLSPPSYQSSFFDFLLMEQQSLFLKSLCLNSFFMSLYIFIFHLMFMMFYWCSSAKNLAITEIFCIGIYLFCSIHHCLFFCTKYSASSLQFKKKNRAQKAQVNPNTHLLRMKASQKKKNEHASLADVLCLKSRSKHLKISTNCKKSTE